jgi:hypothetical protein
MKRQLSSEDKAMVWTLGMLGVLERIGMMRVGGGRSIEREFLQDESLIHFVGFDRQWSPSRRRIRESLVILSGDGRCDESVVESLLDIAVEISTDRTLEQ